jgi:hypothetical protein
VKSVLPSLFLALIITKWKKHSNPTKPITHPITSHPSTPRAVCRKILQIQVRKFTFACFVAVRVAWMSFAFGGREWRRCSHCGVRPPHRHGFPARSVYSHFEPSCFDSPHFPHHGSRATSSNGEVHRIVKTSSGRMVELWIHKIFLTNPNTEPSTFSHSM